MITSNDLRYMRDAKNLGEEWSKCLSRKIGAILVRDKTVLSRGYNGPPRGVPHCNTLSRLQEIANLISNDSDLLLKKADLFNHSGRCPRKTFTQKSGELMHLCPATHAEANAIINAGREGICIKHSFLYCYCPLPCKDCASKIINAGISRVYFLDVEDYDLGSRWIFKHSSVELNPIPIGMIK